MLFYDSILFTMLVHYLLCYQVQNPELLHDDKWWVTHPLNLSFDDKQTGKQECLTFLYY
jgi:hypothetical protein